MYSVPVYSYIKQDLCLLKVFFKAWLKQNSPPLRMKTALTETDITVAAKPFGHTLLHITVLLGWLKAWDHHNTPEVAYYDGIRHALLCSSTRMNHTIIELTLHSLHCIEPKPYHILQFYSGLSHCGLRVNNKTVVLWSSILAKKI